jgi:hypothetical protein
MKLDVNLMRWRLPQRHNLKFLAVCSNSTIGVRNYEDTATPATRALRMWCDVWYQNMEKHVTCLKVIFVENVK